MWSAEAEWGEWRRREWGRLAPKSSSGTLSAGERRETNGNARRGDEEPRSVLGELIRRR